MNIEAAVKEESIEKFIEYTDWREFNRMLVDMECTMARYEQRLTFEHKGKWYTTLDTGDDIDFLRRSK